MHVVLNHVIHFEIGELVYCVSDSENTPYHITGITLRPNGYVLYELSNSGMTIGAHDFELSREKNYANLN